MEEQCVEQKEVMCKKQQYCSLELELVTLEVCDVITTSDITEVDPFSVF